MLAFGFDRMAAAPDPLMLASLPKVADTELRGLQRECIRLMRLEDDKFPGSQPVSFERRHLTPEDEEATRRGVSLLKRTGTGSPLLQGTPSSVDLEQQQR